MPRRIPCKLALRHCGGVNTNQNFTLAEFRHRYVLEDYLLAAGGPVKSNGFHRFSLLSDGASVDQIACKPSRETPARQRKQRHTAAPSRPTPQNGAQPREVARKS